MKMWENRLTNQRFWVQWSHLKKYLRNLKEKLKSIERNA